MRAYEEKHFDIEEGIKIGFAEGRSESLFSSVKNLMSNMGFSAEESMRALGMSESEKALCRARL